MSNSVTRVSFWPAVLCALVSLPAWGQPQEGVGAVAAIWRTQHLELRFASERTHFRCSELDDRIRSLLRLMGATLIETQSAPQCVDGFTSSVRRRIVIRSPVVASEENVRKAREDVTGADQLVARLKGLPDPRTQIKPFAAQWRVVSSRDVIRKPDSSDCEVFKALQHQLLKHMSVHDVRGPSSCGPSRSPKFSAMALIGIEGTIDSLAAPDVLPAG